MQGILNKKKKKKEIPDQQNMCFQMLKYLHVLEKKEEK